MSRTRAGESSVSMGPAVLWSSLNSVVLRFGALVVGVVLARLLGPAQFGVYALALSVQMVLMTVADLGLSADLVRASDPERKAPTVATLGLVAGLLSAGVMIAVSGPTAAALGSPQAGPVIAVLALSLVLAGAGVVPFARLQRELRQRTLFLIALADFAVSTTLTLWLVTLGWGVMSLAVARVAAQSVTLVLQCVAVGAVPRLGLDREQLRPVLAFGLPVAGANLLSWVVLSADNLVVAGLAGPAVLGAYFVAFNVANWPMSAIGQVVRSVALPAFSRRRRELERDGVPARDERRGDATAGAAVGLVWVLLLLAGTALAALARPLIGLVYGPAWEAAAALLVWLGLFGSLRALFDLLAAYLLAQGRSRSLLCVLGLWALALLPLLWWWVGVDGARGAALAHLTVAVLVVLPAYLVALSKAGADVVAVLRSLAVPALAVLPGAALAVWIATWPLPPLASLLLGGLALLVSTLLLVGRWTLRRARELRGPTSAAATAPAAAAEQAPTVPDVEAPEPGPDRCGERQEGVRGS